MTFFPILAAALLTLGQVANADIIRLTTPIQGVSLHGGGVDMAVYYVRAGDRFDVVATYGPHACPADVGRRRLEPHRTTWNALPFQPRRHDDRGVRRAGVRGPSRQDA
ncbi:hypothetical protein [Tropicibacter sp. S64]|uniref:hypothetical protein n=1 Tax=Tropicibacter sp. S64 TaxID=3415122 RepID=UPI003C7BE12D